MDGVEHAVDFSKIKGLPNIPQKPEIITLNVKYTAGGVIVPGDSSFSANTGFSNFNIVSMAPESYGMILHSADISAIITRGTTEHLAIRAVMDIELDNRTGVDKSDYNREIDVTSFGGTWTDVRAENRIQIMQGSTKWLSISEVFEIRCAAIALEFTPLSVGVNGNLEVNLTLNYQIPSKFTR